MSQPLLLQALMGSLVFGTGCLVFLALAPMLKGRADLRHRLAGTRPPPVPTRQATLRADGGLSIWARLVAGVEARGVSLADARAGSLADRMLQAGFPQGHAARLFMLVRTVLTLVLPLAGGTALMTIGGFGLERTYLYVVGFAVAGLYLPNIWLKRRVEDRRQEMRNGFPDTLDLMLICVEAGLGVDACFSRVGQEIGRSHPLLAQQFELVSLELRAGRSREAALKGLVRRTGVTEIGSFVTLIIQSDRLGSSIAQALKAYGGEMREARRMRAEEKAHRLPVLISVPLVAFMLPTMIAVLMLPGVIMVKRDLLPTMTRAQ